MLSLGMETYLTQSERNTMWRHLLISSLLLVLATVSVILWAATVVNRDRARDMTLLPSEVKYPNKFEFSYLEHFLSFYRLTLITGLTFDPGPPV